MRETWYHEVDPVWLETRRDVLTATNVVKLLPEYKRVLRGKADPGRIVPRFAALWASKQTMAEVDPSSTGAAARGHIMEPYAVKDWNAQKSPKFSHWDDATIKRDGFGFSPDAMDVEQPHDGTVEYRMSDDGRYLMAPDGSMLNAPKQIMEIKSYDVWHHMESVVAAKMDHEEIMQIAMAFVVMPKLRYAKLLFYCPDAPISMHCETYSRKDLMDQIELIEKIGEIYKNTSMLCEKLKHRSKLHSITTSAEVYDEFLATRAADNNDDSWRIK